MVFGADAQEAKTTSSQNAYYAFTPSKWSRASISTACSPRARSAPPSTLVTLGLRRQYASDKVEILSGTDQPSDRGNHLTAWQLGVRQDIGAGFGAMPRLAAASAWPTPTNWCR